MFNKSTKKTETHKTRQEMRNRILIKLALWLLEKVDLKKIEYKNSWRYYKSELRSFSTDAE